VVVVSEGRIAPYDSWPRCRDTTPSVARFATGVSGVYYPIAMVACLAAAGEDFLHRCPKADDIWLHWIALRNSVPVRQLSPVPRHFPLLPGTQGQSLMSENVLAGANDARVADLYDAEDVARLVAAGSPVVAADRIS
jgi:hypothetical protein